jgi:Fe-S oxidoreductase
MAQRQSIHPAGSSGYDAHHPPSGELIDKCVHCGFCLPVCPTYVLWNEEMDSPRGRIYLMKMVAEGDATINETWVGHFDACLGCMACMSACPSGVDYAKLIEATRAQIERRYTRSASEKRFRRLLFSIFTRPARLRALLLPLRLYQKAGLEALVRRMGIPKLLPVQLRAMEALLPQVPAQETLPELIPAQGDRRRRVGLLLGCVQRVLFPQVNAATARVLAAEGCEVVVPAAQPCCGALLVHAGEEEQAVQLARQTIDAFENAQADAVIINAAGCGSNVKEYGHLLRDDPQYAGRAKAFAAKCRDVSEFLAELEPRATRCACAWPTTMPATCSTRRASARSRARCWDASRSSNCWKSPKLRSAAAPRESTTWCNRKPRRSSATGKRATSPRWTRTWSCPATPAACCSSSLPSRARGENFRFATSSNCSTRLSAAFPCDVGAQPALLGSFLGE